MACMHRAFVPMMVRGPQLTSPPFLHMAGCIHHAGKAPRIGRRLAARRAASGASFCVDAGLAAGAAASRSMRNGGALAPQGHQDPLLCVQAAQVGAGGEACGGNGPRAAHGAACARSFDVACMRMRDAMLGWCFHIWSAVSRASKSGSKCCLYVFGTIENEIRRGPVMAALTSGPRARSEPPRHGRELILNAKAPPSKARLRRSSEGVAFALWSP